MKKFAALAVTALALSLSACGERVTINSAEVGKQLHSGGFEEEVRHTGTMWMDYCWFSLCPVMVKMSVAKNTELVQIDSIYLPNSNVDVQAVKVGVQWRPREDVKSVDVIYNETASEHESTSVRRIESKQLWTNYGARVIPAAIVDVIKDMTVDEVMNTSSELSKKIKNRVDSAVANLPIEVTQLDIVNTDVPSQVLEAKYKLFSIKDNQNRQIQELKVGVEIENQRQALQKTRANNDKEIAYMLGMTPSQYMCLKTAERMADAADNKGATIVINGNCGLGGSSENTVVPVKAKENEEGHK